MSKTTAQSLKFLRLAAETFFPAGQSRSDLIAYLEELTRPIPMRLVCEGCGQLHIDEGEFAEKPHHTHVCQHCGLTWRPAIGPTVGVQFLPGFQIGPKPAAGTYASWCPARYKSPLTSEGLGSQPHEAAQKTSCWEPKPGDWSRYTEISSIIVQLGEFSKLTGRFFATALDGTPLCPSSAQLTRWIPRIDERVTLVGNQAESPVFGVVVNNGFEPGPEGLPFFMVKLADGAPCKAYLFDLKPAPPIDPPVSIGSIWMPRHGSDEVEVVDVEKLHDDYSIVRAYRKGFGTEIYALSYFTRHFIWRRDA